MHHFRGGFRFGWWRNLQTLGCQVEGGLPQTTVQWRWGNGSHNDFYYFCGVVSRQLLCITYLCMSLFWVLAPLEELYNRVTWGWVGEGGDVKVELPKVYRACSLFYHLVVISFWLSSQGILFFLKMLELLSQPARVHGSRVLNYFSYSSTGRTVNLHDYDSTTVTSLLKLYLRELPSNILTTRLAPIFDSCIGKPWIILFYMWKRGSLWSLKVTLTFAEFCELLSRPNPQWHVPVEPLGKISPVMQAPLPPVKQKSP